MDYKHYIFFCHQYKIEYIAYKKEDTWVMEILPKDIDEGSSFIIKSKDKNKSRKYLKQYVKYILKTKNAEDFIKKYSVYFSHPDIIKNAKENNISFHITKSINREKILKQGLIPNGNVDRDVLHASLLVDKKKPSNIPDWVKRSQSVYSYPSLSNEVVGFSENEYQSNKDLWVINITGEQCWVGSQGIGGYCLPWFEDGQITKERYLKWSTNKNTLKYSTLYWKNSCSWKDFISGIGDKNKWGLDEILISNKINPSKIFLAGSWNNKGCFIPSSRFLEILKEEYKNNFNEILNKY